MLLQSLMHGELDILQSIVFPVYYHGKSLGTLNSDNAMSSRGGTVLRLTNVAV